jgi:hypothetical protein
MQLFSYTLRSANCPMQLRIAQFGGEFNLRNVDGGAGDDGVAPVQDIVPNQHQLGRCIGTEGKLIVFPPLALGGRIAVRASFRDIYTPTPD